MGGLSRRAALAAGLSLLMVSGAAAQQKEGPPPIKSVFKYLDAYWKIPAAERSRFTLAYYMKGLNGGAPAGVKMYVVQGGERTALDIASNGRVELPTLAMLNSKGGHN
jgi:hypothetical protein